MECQTATGPSSGGRGRARLRLMVRRALGAFVLLVVVALGALGAVSAERADAAGPPAVVTGSASGLTQTAAILNATVNPEGEEVTECYFEYGTSTSYGASAPCSSLPGSGTSPVAVSAEVSSLSANTMYYFRIAAVNAEGTSYGSEEAFSSLPNSPAVITGAASSVTATTAMLHATVDPEGGEVSACEFEYGTSPSFGASVPCASLPGSGSSPVAVSAEVSGLSADTSYYFRIVATNAGGTSYGAEETFETPFKAPTVVTGSASSLGQVSATLNAAVNPNEATVSDCHFDYGPTEAYGSSVACTSLPGSGSSPVAVSAEIAGLRPGSTYHFRIVATSPGGTADGSDGAFVTASPALPEIGRCMHLGNATGKYKTSACTTTSHDENTGAYEWQPWPAAKDQFSLASNAPRLETVGKGFMECLNATVAGEYTGSQTAAVTVTFRSCAAVLGHGHGGSCQSEGANAGEVRTYGLEARLGVIKNKVETKPTVGWDLQPASGSDLATLQCGTTEVSLTGSVIARTTVLDKMAASSELKFSATKAKQKPESFEGLPSDVLGFLTTSGDEQAGLNMDAAGDNAEPVEIKAIA